MQVIQCQVHMLKPLTDHVYKVLLKPETHIDFIPGQYLSLVMSEEDKRPFSIANMSNQDYIELQIGAYGEDSYAMQAIEKLQSCEQVTIEIPMGNAYLRTASKRPLLLVAGGTGFSYIKSMFEYLSAQQSEREVIVYWGLREASACYELAKTSATISALPNGTFHPVLQNASDDWQGKTGLVHKSVLKDFDSLADYDIYIAGRFEMVGVLRDDFIAHGALKDHMYADAFAFI